MQTSTTMPPTRRRCLQNFGLWMSCCKGMCVPWDTKRNDEIFSSLPFIHFIRGIGVSFLISFGGRCISFGRECTNELRTPPEAGVCLSLFSSLTFFERRGLKAMRRMGQSLRAYTSAESSGTRVVPTCLKPQQHHSHGQS